MVLDEESSLDSQGFNFNDTATGYKFLVGGGPKGAGNSIIDSEDMNNNGVLDLESPDMIKTFGPYGISGTALPGDDWQLKTLTLTANDRPYSDLYSQMDT